MFIVVAVMLSLTEKYVIEANRRPARNYYRKKLRPVGHAGRFASGNLPEPPREFCNMTFDF